jgi:phosphoribosylformimino-5-aminoimidazole carboxamide ribotide isomerase
MIAVPAVDLKGGRCVQLVGGRPEEERVSLPDPVAVARRWWEAGFRHLHVVDLDGALSSGENIETIRSLVESTDADIQVGGGVRTEEDIRLLLEWGVHRVIIGTRAIDDPEWLLEVTEIFPGRIMVAADVRQGRVLRRGWTDTTELPVGMVLSTLAQLPLAGVLWTDVGREGRVDGIDLEGARRVADASPHPVWIAGGVSSMRDLAGLEVIGARAAVLGMALYTEALDPREVAEEYGSGP